MDLHIYKRHRIKITTSTINISSNALPLKYYDIYRMSYM